MTVPLSKCQTSKQVLFMHKYKTVVETMCRTQYTKLTAVINAWLPLPCEPPLALVFLSPSTPEWFQTGSLRYIPVQTHWANLCMRIQGGSDSGYHWSAAGTGWGDAYTQFCLSNSDALTLAWEGCVWATVCFSTTKSVWVGLRKEACVRVFAAYDSVLSMCCALVCTYPSKVIIKNQS